MRVHSLHVTICAYSHVCFTQRCCGAPPSEGLPPFVPPFVPTRAIAEDTWLHSSSPTSYAGRTPHLRLMPPTTLSLYLLGITSTWCFVDISFVSPISTLWMWGKSLYEVTEEIIIWRLQNTISWTGSEAECRDAVCAAWLQPYIFGLVSL